MRKLNFFLLLFFPAVLCAQDFAAMNERVINNTQSVLEYRRTMSRPPTRQQLSEYQGRRERLARSVDALVTTATAVLKLSGEEIESSLVLDRLTSSTP